MTRASRTSARMCAPPPKFASDVGARRVRPVAYHGLALGLCQLVENALSLLVHETEALPRDRFGVPPDERRARHFQRNGAAKGGAHLQAAVALWSGGGGRAAGRAGARGGCAPQSATKAAPRRRSRDGVRPR